MPSELVGKDIREIAQEFQRQKNISETYRNAMNSPPQPQQQPQYQQQQPPQQAAFSSQEPAEPDPGLSYTNPVEYQRQNRAWVQGQIQSGIAQAAGPLLANVADTARWQSQNDANYADTWAKYGHEIEAMASQVPAHMRNLAAYTMFAKVVKAEHLDELIDQRARQLAASGGFGTERSGLPGQAPSFTGDKLSQLFQNPDHPFVVKCRKNETSEADVRAHCRAQGRDPDDYATAVMKGSVLVA